MLTIPTAPEFWHWLMLFAYKQYSKHCTATSVLPVGVPNNRDPLSPCTGFAPRPVKLGDYLDCQTDGHYLCQLCCHRKATVETQELDFDIQVTSVRSKVRTIGKYEAYDSESFIVSKENRNKLTSGREQNT